ncbi:MAG: sensor histidine kinase, partial [Nitrospiraceae bacterium]
MSDRKPALRIVGSRGKSTFGGSAASPVADKGSREKPGASHRIAGVSGASDGWTHLAESLGVTERRLSKMLEDRERMGRDLHNSVLQSVYAIRQSIDAARRSGRTDHSPFQSHAAHAVNQVNRLIQDIRGFIFELETDTVTGLDLDREFQDVIDWYRSLCRPQFQIDIDPAAALLLTSEESRHLVSIGREGLSNSVRHAQAARIVVSLRRRGKNLRFEVR